VEPITGVWGRSPQWGPGAEPLVGGSRGEAPLKLKHILLLNVEWKPEIRLFFWNLETQKTIKHCWILQLSLENGKNATFYIKSPSSSSSTTVGSMPVGVWRHSYYRCPPWHVPCGLTPAGLPHTTAFIRLYWHQISFVLLLYGQRIDTHLTDPPLGTDRGFPLVSDHRTNEAQFIKVACKKFSWSGQRGHSTVALPLNTPLVSNNGAVFVALVAFDGSWALVSVCNFKW